MASTLRARLEYIFFKKLISLDNVSENTELDS